MRTNKANLMIYGSYGFVGKAITRLAVRRGFKPVLAGRSAPKVHAQADELGLESRIFELNDSRALIEALDEMKVVLHCAGPYIHTYQPMITACLETGTHYLDISGEIPVYQGISKRDKEAKEQGVMLMPGVGFDVTPTDCLAVHLKQRLPSANHLTLAFQSIGPAGITPGAARTLAEMLPYGNLLRQNGKLIQAAPGEKSRLIDFGNGSIKAVRTTWGDIFTAYFSTGILNIEDYIVLEEKQAKLLKSVSRIRSLFKNKLFRAAIKRMLPSGSTKDERDLTFTRIWGEAKDPNGIRAITRLYGPEAGVEWTSDCALLSVEKVLKGRFTPGFQTPGSAYGADFVMECTEVIREDVL